MNLNEIKKHMEELKDWAIEGDSIVKNLSFASFREEIDFVNKVADIAEKHNHYPDILITSTNLRIALTTYSAGSLTEKDFKVAKEIDLINN